MLYLVIKNQDVIKKPEVNGILSSSGLKTSLRKIPLFGDVLLWMQFIESL